jgi:hypothetical protein
MSLSFSTSMKNRYTYTHDKSRRPGNCWADCHTPYLNLLFPVSTMSPFCMIGVVLRLLVALHRTPAITSQYLHYWGPFHYLVSTFRTWFIKTRHNRDIMIVSPCAVRSLFLLWTYGRTEFDCISYGRFYTSRLNLNVIFHTTTTLRSSNLTASNFSRTVFIQ